MVTLSFKLIDRYQRECPTLMKKITCVEYKKGSFRGGRNTIKLIRHKNKIFIPQQLQKYIVKWHCAYLLHPVWDITKAMIHQHLYWPDIINDVQKEVTDCDLCQRKKRSTKKYGQLSAKLPEEILWNKICVYLIIP